MQGLQHRRRGHAAFAFGVTVPPAELRPHPVLAQRRLAERPERQGAVEGDRAARPEIATRPDERRVAQAQFDRSVARRGLPDFRAAQQRCDHARPHPFRVRGARVIVARGFPGGASAAPARGVERTRRRTPGSRRPRSLDPRGIHGGARVATLATPAREVVTDRGLEVLPAGVPGERRHARCRDGHGALGVVPPHAGGTGRLHGHPDRGGGVPLIRSRLVRQARRERPVAPGLPVEDDEQRVPAARQPHLAGARRFRERLAVQPRLESRAGLDPQRQPDIRVGCRLQIRVGEGGLAGVRPLREVEPRLPVAPDQTPDTGLRLEIAVREPVGGRLGQRVLARLDFRARHQPAIDRDLLGFRSGGRQGADSRGGEQDRAYVPGHHRTSRPQSGGESASHLPNL